MQKRCYSVRVVFTNPVGMEQLYFANGQLIPAWSSVKDLQLIAKALIEDKQKAKGKICANRFPGQLQEKAAPVT